MASQVILKKSSVATRVPAPGDLVYGELALNYTDGKLYYKTNANNIAVLNTNNTAPTATYTRNTFTATAGQTIFSVTYTVGYLEVYYNGVLQPSVDYTATNGTSITLATAASAGDTIETIAYATGSIVSTLDNVTLNNGYTEEVFPIPTNTTPALSPTNGSIQTWTLTGNSTPTAGTWAEGQSLTLMIDDGTAYTITWTSMPITWKTGTGSAPTLVTTGYTAITFWKVGTVIYGARVGNV